MRSFAPAQTSSTTSELVVRKDATATNKPAKTPHHTAIFMLICAFQSLILL